MIATKTPAPMGSPWHMHFCSFVITLQIFFLLLFCVKINYFHCHCHCHWRSKGGGGQGGLVHSL